MRIRAGLIALGIGGAGLGGALAGGADGGLDRAHPFARRLEWRSARPGVDWAEVRLSGGLEARAIKLMVARIDPRRTQLALEWGMTAIGQPAWDVGRVESDVAIAFNVGMFVEALPWGWAVVNGAERLPPGHGPLSSAIAITRSGQVLWRDGDHVADLRARTDLALAFQSYPTLLVGDGELPTQLRPGATAIDLAHRDARLALGVAGDGSLIVALTRLDLTMPGADRIPFGLTVPEMAAVMRGLGAHQAMLLDGGISAQLAIGRPDGTLARWPSLRRVPLALIGRSTP